MRITYDDVKTKVSMYDILAKYGHELKKNGSMPCPLHGGDNPTGFGVHDQGMKWSCRTRDCGKSASNIDFVALKENCSAQEAFIRIKEMFNMVDEPDKPVKKKPKPKQVGASLWYDYVTEDGDLAYRMERVSYDDGAKRFVPHQPNGDRKCPKESRVLYNLKAISENAGDYVVLCEGEKTADAIISCGLIGTTFPFGCGSWAEQYVESLRGQRVVLMPDADESGDKWLKEVSEGLAGHVESTMVIPIPDKFVLEHPEFNGHDFADYLEINGREKSVEFMAAALVDTQEIPKGIDRSSLNIATDICRNAVEEIRANDGKNAMDLSRMYGPEMDIEAFAGDVIMVIAPTGVGKTRILHNFPYVYKELNFMAFDLELTQSILGIRYTAMHNFMSFKEARERIKKGMNLELPIVENVFLPKIAHLTVDKIKEEVDRVEMITGRRIHVVAIDYVAKMNRMGSATESVERHCSEFKNYCAQENRWGIITTQSSRGHDKANPDYRMPNKEDAIHSSAIEQSCQEALCFCFKSEYERDTLLLKCDKYSHGDKPTETLELATDNLHITYKGVNVKPVQGEW